MTNLARIIDFIGPQVGNELPVVTTAIIVIIILEKYQDSQIATIAKKKNYPFPTLDSTTPTSKDKKKQKKTPPHIDP